MANTIITSGLVLALAATACESRRTEKATPQPPRTPDATPTKAPTETKTNVSPIKLTWSLSRTSDGNALTLDYVIENSGEEPVFVVDDHAKSTVKGLEVTADAVAVHPGADEKTARLIAGHVPLPPGAASAVVPIAPARELAPGAKRSGKKTVPLPLKGWVEAQGLAVDLAGATRATFEVTWLRPPPPGRDDWAWEVQKDAAGKTIRTPFLGYVNTMGGQTQTTAIAIP